MGNVRPTLSEFQEPEPGVQFEVNLAEFSRTLLWGLLLAVIVVSVTAVSISSEYLDQDADRLVNNAPLRSWAGLAPIWRQAHRFPDFSPLTYSSFLVEARLWNVSGPRSPAGFRAVNVAAHLLAVLALWHLLRRLEVPGAWTAAAVFGVHPVTLSTVGWITQRPVIFGTLLALLTLIVFYRIIGLNPKPESAHRLFRLPESSLLLWVIALLLLMLTLFASPAIAAILWPVTLIILWWEHGKLERRDWVQTWPLLAVSLLVTVGGVLLLWRQGIGEVAIAGVPAWYRPILAVQQIGFYALMVVAPLQLQFAYEPFARMGMGTIAALVFVPMTLAAAWWASRRWGRGPLAAVAMFILLLLLPSLIWAQTEDLFGGWVGLSRLYPASMVIITAVVATVAWILQFRSKEASIAAAGAVVAVAAAGGAYQAWLHRSPIRLWDNVLAQDPQHAVAVVRRTSRMIDAGELNPAERMLNDVIAARPAAIAPLVQLGELERIRKQYDRAMAAFLRVLNMDPRNFDATLGLARCRAERGDSGGAIAQYGKVLELRPNDPNVLNELGLVHAFRGELGLAENYYRTALRIDPRCTNARINLANLLYQQGKVEEAANELTVVVELDRDSFEAYMNAGAILGQMQQYSKAAVLFRRAVTLKPDMAHAYGNLGMALLGQVRQPGVAPSEQLGLLGEALFMFEKASELDPTNTEFPKYARDIRIARDAMTTPKP